MKRLALIICVCGLAYVWPHVEAVEARQNSKKSVGAVIHKDKFAEVELVLNEHFNVDYIRSLSRSSGSGVEILSDSKKARVQIPAEQVKALVDEGADVTMLKKFILIEGYKEQAGTLETNAMLLESCSGTYSYGENDDDVDIPDDDSGWAYSDIYLFPAPPGATVICMDVHYEIIHSYVGDLVVDLTNEDMSKEYNLWENEGGNTSNINETVTGITTFNGELVNQIWTLWALDTFPYYDSGYIDYWWIKVYYEETGDLYMQADSYFENTAEISFAFTSDPGTVCFSASGDCGSFDPICDEPVIEDSNYWVSTEYTPCEDECISVTVTADPTLGMDQTKTIHLYDRLHIGCCLPTELGFSTYDPETGEPNAAFVNVSVIPGDGGTMDPPSGWSEWDPSYHLYLFWSTYTPDCDYTGRARVKLQTTDDTTIFSFDQNPFLTSASHWRIVSDSFCTVGWDLNNYQVYKMYLCSNASYDFSLCDNDGLGASCDGDGDLEIFDSSCESQWYIDGDPECKYDASTIGTDYEGWSPQSDGYYYLIVSDYFGKPMSYSLAYKGGTAGDFEPDCDVDFFDLAILGNQWLQSPGIPSADIAPEVPDNFVDTLDLAALVENWLVGTMP